MAFGAIIIGDEILSGKRQDKHLAKSIEILGARGLELGWAEYVGDDPARITAALRRTFASSDIVFSFGGIGATPDDHTRQCAAAATGRSLAIHPEGLKELEARFGTEITERRLRMIEFPEGSAIVPNPYNRIPGFSIERHYFLPGFPEMAHPMMAWVLDTKYTALRPEVRAVEQAILVRVGESFLIDIMNAVVRDYPELKLSSLPQNVEGGYLVELAVRGDPQRVPRAMAYVRAEVAKLGYAFEERARGLTMEPRRRALLLAGTGALLLPRAALGERSTWDALRAGGHVILMRHASTEPGLGDPKDFKLGECATQRNLSEAGREEARRVAQRLRSERVAIERAYTSPWCRCRDTAVLAYGRSEDWEPLSSFFDMPHREADLTESVRKRILGYSIRKPAGNVAMVTHNVNIAALTKLSVAPAELVVVRPDGCCALKVVGRLRV